MPTDAAAAQTLTAARRLDMEIVTADRHRWAPIEQRVSFPLPLIELSDNI